MRNFSEFEKKIINKLIAIDPIDSNAGTFIADTILENRGIKIEEQELIISLWYLKTDKKAISEFFELISLLNYLEKNDLIFIHSNPERPIGTRDFLTKNIDQHYLDSRKDDLVSMPIPTDIFERIVRYLRSYLICGTEIKVLVTNKFKTQEQIDHEAEMKEATSQTRLSRCSIYVAFAALAFSFLSPLIFDTTIDKTQINKINTANQAQVDNLIDIKKFLKESIDSTHKQAHTPNSTLPKAGQTNVK
jgi:hypothetical protein